MSSFASDGRCYRFRSALITAFGVIALLLATAGVFAVVAYAVVRRTRELAMRVAVGATTRDLTRAIVPGIADRRLAPAWWWASCRLPASCRSSSRCCSTTSARLRRSIYAVAAAAFLSAAAVATWIPLRRAWRLDPAITLRQE